MVTVTGASASAFVLLVAACAALPACADAVHDDLVRSLGPENPAVPPGPLHRPAQPCLACHGGIGPASRALSLGGTVYAVPDGTQPAVGAIVHVEDINLHAVEAETNEAGNFFVRPDTYTPTYPIRMTVTSSNHCTTQQMLSLSLRAGSCADCHTNPFSAISPGLVYVSSECPPAGLDGGSD